MGKKIKFLIILFIVVSAVAATTGYIMWNKPQRRVETEKGIAVSAAKLVKDYQANEASANTMYLDKAIQVTGTVTEIKNNQDGQPTVTLASEDAFTGVFCTLKENVSTLAPGSTVTIKGICSGMLSDVRLREAVVINK